MSKLSKLSTKDLFAIALKTSLDDLNSHKSWNALNQLQKRSTRKVYKRARKLCHSKNRNEREVGATILAQFGRPATSPFHKKRLRLLLKMINAEDDPTMLHSLAISLGHFHNKRVNPAMLKLKNHSDASVRYAVASGQYTYDDKNADAIEALIELSADSSDKVRDWATFRLHLLEVDTEAIRAALFARLSDSVEEIRDEALSGLAQRRYRVLEPLPLC
ncbi:MAG: HEAT repeat domain-containing protein [Chloroflexota bacterium]